MNKVGSRKNYGYGKQLAWAGKQALIDRYGNGHYATRATHGHRWQQFVNYIKANGINDARHINKTMIDNYGYYLRDTVNNQDMSVAYAQNLLSTVNVILETMRKNPTLTVKPAAIIGQRSHVRTIAPISLDDTVLTRSLHSRDTDDDRSLQSMHGRITVIARLARHFGLRFSEASKLNIYTALQQAAQHKKINITAGTKGGRGKHVDRWVPVSQKGLSILKQAISLQGDHHNLIPPELSYEQWRSYAYHHWAQHSRIKGFHDMRAAYACERYQQLTGHPAPVINQTRTATKRQDQHARKIIAEELGHNRISVTASYIGSAR